MGKDDKGNDFRTTAEADGTYVDIQAQQSRQNKAEIKRLAKETQQVMDELKPYIEAMKQSGEIMEKLKKGSDLPDIDIVPMEGMNKKMSGKLLSPSTPRPPAKPETLSFKPKTSDGIPLK